MERAANTLLKVLAEAIRRLPAEELPGAAWEFAAGPAVSAKTRVLSCVDNVLLLEVPDVNWRSQLSSMAPQLLSRLNQLLRVERLEFKLLRPQDEPRKFFPKSPRTNKGNA